MDPSLSKGGHQLSPEAKASDSDGAHSELVVRKEAQAGHWTWGRQR